MDAPNILSFGSLDRSFVFPGQSDQLISFFSSVDMNEGVLGVLVFKILNKYSVQVNKFIFWHVCPRISMIQNSSLHLKLLR